MIKLVRDKFPEKMNKKEQSVFTTVSSCRDFHIYLERKLIENYTELVTAFHQNDDNQKIDKIVETMKTLITYAEALGRDKRDLEEIMKLKDEEDGGYDKRLLVWD